MSLSKLHQSLLTIETTYKMSNTMSSSITCLLKSFTSYSLYHPKSPHTLISRRPIFHGHNQDQPLNPDLHLVWWSGPVR